MTANPEPTNTVHAHALDVAWRHGRSTKKHPAEPPIQIYRYDESTVIMRQSKTLSYEAPFMFLLFGAQRALLVDTGATEDPQTFPLRATVDDLIDQWLSVHPCDGYELVVAHTHGHSDHVAGDVQFTGRAATQVVPRDGDEMRSFFGFDDRWPAQTVTCDLGGRLLELIGSPGHHAAAITIYDPHTGILLTGDTVIPGRLYVFDMAAYRDTLSRLVDFTTTRTVTHVLGCHIEMTRKPGRDYALGATYQPKERPLEMTVAQLVAVRDAVVTAGDRPGISRYNDFVLYAEPRQRDMLRLVVMSSIKRNAAKIRSAVGAAKYRAKA